MVVLLLLLLLIIGWLTPNLLISNSLDGFSGDERPAAKDALVAAMRGCSNRVGWSLVVPALRVSRVDLQPGYAEWPGSWESGRRYRAEVREFTLFGIPLGTTVVRTEDGVRGRIEVTCAF
jgi:hypothetical protein